MTPHRNSLLAVQFHNQLLIDGQVDVVARGQREHAALIGVAVHLQPSRRRLMAGKVLCNLQHRELVALLAYRDLVSNIHLERRDVDLSAIHRNVTVADKLAGLTARDGEPEAVYHVVETALQLLEQHLAGNALGAGGTLEVVAELAFLGEVNALGLLLFAQLQAVAHDFRLAVLAMLAGSKIALLDWTLIAEAFGAFEEQLHALAAAETADGISVTGQVASPLDDRFTGLASPFVPDGKNGRWSFVVGLGIRTCERPATEDQRRLSKLYGALADG